MYADVYGIVNETTTEGVTEMPKVTVYNGADLEFEVDEVTLTPRDKKEREANPSFGEENLSILFGKGGKYALDIDAAGNAALWDSEGDLDELFNLNLLKLPKKLAKLEKLKEKASQAREVTDELVGITPTAF